MLVLHIKNNKPMIETLKHRLKTLTFNQNIKLQNFLEPALPI